MSIFRFKEFVVSQESCPMKINTDGVLLGALANVSNAKHICDIGTGTGVIALMLAQRNKNAKIDALDIDYRAVDTATKNFENSLFHARLKCYHHSFVEFFEMNPLKKYDVIVSNPPFFLNALKADSEMKNLARHTDISFFLDLLRVAATHLEVRGSIQLIIPLDVSQAIQQLASDYHLSVSEVINIKSFVDKEAFRQIIRLSKEQAQICKNSDFVIYSREKEHSMEYRAALKDFFTIF